jgi:hypothetical protein
LILIVGSPEQLLGAFSSYAIVIAIMFSPQLQKFLTHPFFISLGEISFPLYLLHGTFIRGPLAYAYFVILPWLHYLTPPVGIEGAGYYVMECYSLACVSTAVVMYITWIMGLVLFCQIWLMNVDVPGVRFSAWCEQVATGKKGFGESIGSGGSVGGWRLAEEGGKSAERVTSDGKNMNTGEIL